MTLCNTIFLFITTFLLQWMKKYLIDIVKLSEAQANIGFITVCLTAPIIGILLGGLISQKLGGYGTLKSLYLCLLNSFLCGIIGILLIFITHYIAFAILIWTFLFLGSMINPIINGSILSSLPLELKGSGNTIQFIFSNLVGVSSAPFVYGVIYQVTHDWLPSFSMGICLSSSFLASFLIFLLIRNNKKYGNELQDNIK